MQPYQNPPLVEALFAINFEPFYWDETLIGTFGKQIREQYPIQSTQNQIAIRFEISEGQPKANPAENTGKIVECKASNESSLVRFGKGILSVHVLRPYLGWEVFKPQIMSAVSILLHLTKGVNLKTCSLRYVNHINTGEKLSFANVAQYFVVKPVVPESLQEKLGAIQCFLEFLQPNGEDVLTLTQTTLQPIGEMLAPVQLDLMYTSISADRMQTDYLPDWLETAHDTIEHTFHESITTFARQQFGEQ